MTSRGGWRGCRLVERCARGGVLGRTRRGSRRLRERCPRRQYERSGRMDEMSESLTAEADDCAAQFIPPPPEPDSPRRLLDDPARIEERSRAEEADKVQDLVAERDGRRGEMVGERRVEAAASETRVSSPGARENLSVVLRALCSSKSGLQGEEELTRGERGRRG